MDRSSMNSQSINTYIHTYQIIILTEAIGAKAELSTCDGIGRRTNIGFRFWNRSSPMAN